jgi:signal peptidase
MNRPGWLLKAVAGALILYGAVLVAGGVRDRLRRRGAGTVPQVEPADDAADDVVTTVAVAAAPPTPKRMSRGSAGRTPQRTAIAVAVLVGVVLTLSVVSRRSR